MPLCTPSAKLALHLIAIKMCYKSWIVWVCNQKHWSQENESKMDQKLTSKTLCSFSEAKQLFQDGKHIFVYLYFFLKATLSFSLYE